MLARADDLLPCLRNHEAQQPQSVLPWPEPLLNLERVHPKGKRLYYPELVSVVLVNVCCHLHFCDVDHPFRKLGVGSEAGGIHGSLD